MNIDWHIKKFNELNIYELYEILDLRNEVFVVEQNCVYLDTDDLDKRSCHIFLRMDDQIVAYARIYPSKDHEGEISFGRVVVRKTYRNRGLAKELLKRTFQCAYDVYGNLPVRIHAQCYLEMFYEEFGFQRVSEDFLEDGIAHVKMLKKA